MSRILVTGAAGFIGFEVTKALLGANFEVIGIDNFDETLNSDAQRRSRIARFKHSSFNFIEANLLYCRFDQFLHDVDVVFHFAATPGLLPSWTHFSKYVDNNILASYKVAEAIQKSSTIKKLVVASTSSVYGEFAIGDEKSEIHPSSPYGISKVATEQIFHALLNDCKFDTYILRLFSVFGPNQREDMVWAKVINSILLGVKFPLTARPNHVRTCTYVGDISDLCTKLVKLSGKSGIYNICGGEEVNILEGIQIIEKLMGKRLNVEYAPSRRGDQVKTIGNSALAIKNLSFSPKTDFLTGIQNQITQAIMLQTS